MSTTLQTMRDEVKLALGSRDDITDAMIDAWLNVSQLALASRLRIYEIEEAVTFALQIGIDVYGAPSNLFTPVIMVNTSNNREEVKLRPLKTVVREMPTPNARVSKYTLRGSTLVFRPAPSTTDTMEWTYKKRPATMSGSVNLTLPDEFGPAVVFDAIVRAMHLTGEEDRANIFRRHRDDALASIGDVRGDEFAQRQEGVVMEFMNPPVRLA